MFWQGPSKSSALASEKWDPATQSTTLSSSPAKLKIKDSSIAIPCKSRSSSLGIAIPSVAMIRDRQEEENFYRGLRRGRGELLEHKPFVTREPHHVHVQILDSCACATCNLFRSMRIRLNICNNNDAMINKLMMKDRPDQDVWKKDPSSRAEISAGWSERLKAESNAASSRRLEERARSPRSDSTSSYYSAEGRASGTTTRTTSTSSYNSAESFGHSEPELRLAITLSQLATS